MQLICQPEWSPACTAFGHHESHSRHTWWSLLIRGFAALALAVLLLILREISLSHMALLFFGYAMIDGVVNLAGAITAAQSHQRWGSLLLEAIGGIAVGLISIAWPGMTMM
jgi:uncharacterized membrane protein HdeD (DUF308 family)